MNENNWGCLDALIFLVIFINSCVIRCDQVRENNFNNKVKEIENMIERQQNQAVHLQQQNDSLLLIIKEIKEK